MEGFASYYLEWHWTIEGGKEVSFIDRISIFFTSIILYGNLDILSPSFQTESIEIKNRMEKKTSYLREVEEQVSFSTFLCQINRFIQTIVTIVELTDLYLKSLELCLFLLLLLDYKNLSKTHWYLWC